MDSPNCLLVRNLRGNWSIRLIYEYKLRNVNNTKFSYIDLSNLEYFPPGKSSPTLVPSRIREKIISRIFLKIDILPARKFQNIFYLMCLFYNSTESSLCMSF